MKSLGEPCATQRFCYAEVVKEDRRRNPKATGPNSYVCTQCGYWHVRRTLEYNPPPQGEQK